MKKLLLIFIVFSTSYLFAEPMQIVDVRRNIPLSNEEAPFKDFYIKIAGKDSLKKNQVVKAVRKVSVKDAAQKSIGDFTTTVGLLKIIHTSETIAVAREYKLVPRESEPMLEQVGIMSGDEIDLSESFVENTKTK